MQQNNPGRFHIPLIGYLIKWTLLVLPVAVVVGSLVALFLWMLETVIGLGHQYRWLLYFLPLAGLFINWLYRWSGRNAEAGNNLIIDEIHQPGGGVPFRMTPLVLLTTVLTHLFGGSAGREGTAVQMGGSIAQYFARLFRLSPADLRILLICGVAAGFGAVFGTPVTGALFALEVVTLGRMRYDALLPGLIASLLAHLVCMAWGTQHTLYQIHFTEPSGNWLHFDLGLLVKVIGAAAAFGIAGFLFAEACHAVKFYANRWIPKSWMIPVCGGLLIILLCWLLDTRDYLSLGVSQPDSGSVSILRSFQAGGAEPFSWFWKLIFTAITLGTGFKGGEVTPLFFVGAALGNTLAVLTGAPVDLMAGLGFIAVFAGATNTPVACTLMGVELFGGQHLIYYAVACFTAYYFSGHTGIYGSQRIGASKLPWWSADTGSTLSELRANKRHNKKRERASEL
ncbi:voltage-gated chloride channel family protein [Niabella terrae]